ncbi:MAG TPA: hypothetical protein VIE12_10475, partial [Actinomycetota bacterium]
TVQTVSWKGIVNFTALGSSQPSGDQGIFKYAASGSLTFDYTYAGGGCTGTGSTQYEASSQDKLTMRFGPNANYEAHLKVSPGTRISVTINCPGAPPVPLEWDIGGWFWLFTGPQPKSFPDLGLERLQDTAASPAPAPTTYSWNLKAVPLS